MSNSESLRVLIARLACIEAKELNSSTLFQTTFKKIHGLLGLDDVTLDKSLLTNSEKKWNVLTFEQRLKLIQNYINEAITSFDTTCDIEARERLEAFYKSKKPIRYDGRLLGITKSDGLFLVYPYGGGNACIADLSTVDQWEEADHPTTSNSVHLQEAYFMLGDDIIAKGYHNPEYRWNGFAVPMFELNECEKIVQFIQNDDDDFYEFKRIEGGFLFTDRSYPNEPVTLMDTILENGNEKLIVNSLADGWTWDDIAPSMFDEFNRQIECGEIRSTVKTLTPFKK